MPQLSQWYIKLSFGYLLLGFTAGDGQVPNYSGGNIKSVSYTHL